MVLYKQKLFGRTDSAVQITHWYKASLITALLGNDPLSHVHGTRPAFFSCAPAGRVSYSFKFYGLKATNLSVHRHKHMPESSPLESIT